MKLHDLDAGRDIPLPALKAEWKEFRSEDPENHADNFATELLEILLATINGRNNCDVVGLTPSETCRFIIRLRSICNA